MNNRAVENQAFLNFEQKLMPLLIETSEYSEKEKIKKQYENAYISGRKFTGVGFFTDFIVEDKSLYLPREINLELGRIHVDLEGTTMGAGFILFVSNGVIDTLEGYTYGEDTWPKKIKKYSFKLINNDGTLTPSLRV
ncbi:MAG: hypothetical protein LBL58_15395 [Tannerellaceae bacterium]|jgi:hypothetical protein|nr:hypothetical protein [Tannerellaceae bacterium]